EAVRRALGERVRLMVDVNQRLDVLGNIRQAALLEDLDLVWYEEPVLADDIAACAEVSEKIGIPVATGENNYTRYEFRELIERRAARYLMPDVCRANGYSETLRIARLAAAHSVAVSPHVVHELSLHVVGALANGFLVEFIDWTPPDLFQELPPCRDGPFQIAQTYMYLTQPEVAFVEAAVARLIPADELGPGAKEAGVACFIDRQLVGAWGTMAKMYRQGPWPEGTPQQGYQSPLTPQQVYRVG